MLKKEFEERAGLKGTNKEYVQIENAFLAGSGDKDVFCQERLNKLSGTEFKTKAERKIEIEYPPMAKGSLTIKTFMEAIMKKVQNSPEYKRAEAIIEYMMANEYTGDIEITEYQFRFYAAITCPKSEGLYIDCLLSGEFDDSRRKKIGIGIVKTLHESKEAMLVMGELCGLLTWTANEILNEQISRGYFAQ